MDWSASKKAGYGTHCMNVLNNVCYVNLSLTLSPSYTHTHIHTHRMVAIFFYDIFFVFITPLFFDGQSIMLTVAKGGGSDTIADDFCFKYPEERECKGIDFLPMLLIIPRFNDYTRGSSLLGLGDIVCTLYFSFKLVRRLYGTFVGPSCHDLTHFF